MTEVENTIQLHHAEVERLGIGSIEKILSTLEKIKSEIKKDDDINITKYREIEKAIADIKNSRYDIGDTLNTTSLNVKMAEGQKLWDYKIDGEKVATCILPVMDYIYVGTHKGSGNASLIQLTKSGKKNWQNFELYDGVLSLASDSEGNIYAGRYDQWLSKFTPNGKKIKEKKFDGWVRAVCIDSKDNIYVGANKLYKLNKNLDEIFVKDIMCEDVKLDSEGNIYVAEREKIIMLNSAGNKKWEWSDKSKEYNFKCIAPQSTGNYIFASGDYGITKLNKNGDFIQTKKVYANGAILSLMSDKKNYLYYISGALFKYTSDLRFIYSVKDKIKLSGGDALYACNADDDGFAYAGSGYGVHKISRAEYTISKRKGE